VEDVKPGAFKKKERISTGNHFEEEEDFYLDEL
jgi:hypothetical protein